MAGLRIDAPPLDPPRYYEEMHRAKEIPNCARAIAGEAGTTRADSKGAENTAPNPPNVTTPSASQTLRAFRSVDHLGPAHDAGVEIAKWTGGLKLAQLPHRGCIFLPIYPH